MYGFYNKKHEEMIQKNTNEGLDVDSFIESLGVPLDQIPKRNLRYEKSNKGNTMDSVLKCLIAFYGCTPPCDFYSWYDNLDRSKATYEEKYAFEYIDRKLIRVKKKPYPLSIRNIYKNTYSIVFEIQETDDEYISRLKYLFNK